MEVGIIRVQIDLSWGVPAVLGETGVVSVRRKDKCVEGKIETSRMIGERRVWTLCKGE